MAFLPRVEFITTTTTAAECRVAGGDRSVEPTRTNPDGAKRWAAVGWAELCVSGAGASYRGARFAAQGGGRVFLFRDVTQCELL